jgi:hypothetical protein
MTTTTAMVVLANSQLADVGKVGLPAKPLQQVVELGAQCR